jgi:endonuclease/exonuclease/phosphatase family metal-dependent hydrolase
MVAGSGASSEVDYGQLARLGERIAEAESTLDAGRATMAGARYLRFGNTDGAQACQSAYHAVADTAITAAEHMAAVLTTDSERLAGVVALYEETDRATADRVATASGRTLDVFTAHVHSGESPVADYIRAQQIDRYADAVAASDGPAIATMDANVSLDADEQSDNDVRAPEALGRFTDELGFTDAAEEAGPTSSHGERIDYVFTDPGISTGEAEVVDARSDELSDHDGQAVDVEVQRW